MVNPLDMQGPEFLTLYIQLFVAALLYGWIVPRLIRADGRQGAGVDADSLAYLTGSATRMVEAAAARLLAVNALVLDDGKRFLRGSASVAPAGGVERALLAAPTPATWDDLRRAAGPETDAMQRRLETGGLMIDSGDARRIGLIASLGYLALLGLGTAKMLVGMARDKPVGFLSGLLVITVICTAIRYFAVDVRTRSALTAIKAARRQHERLRRAPTTSETGMAVALFGTAALAGSAFSDFHRLRNPGGDGSSDSGSSDSGGDSGCGGGGCGGCGGD